MKSITFIRHAKSSWADPDLKDFDRPLNSRGKSDAPKMGQRLAVNNIFPDLIITSPAKRAKATAYKIARELNFPHSKIIEEMQLYLSSAKLISNVIKAVNDDINNLFIFGHNPDIHELVEILTGKQYNKLPTCSVAHFLLKIDQWKDFKLQQSDLVYYSEPKFISP